jgi:hypothetical protein
VKSSLDGSRVLPKGVFSPVSNLTPIADRYAGAETGTGFTLRAKLSEILSTVRAAHSVRMTKPGRLFVKLFVGTNTSSS